MNWNEWKDLARDEKLWRDSEERGLLKAEHIHDYQLRLWFEEELDVSIYEVDFRLLVVDNNPGGIFEDLKNPERFQLVLGDYSLVWLNPDTGVYDEEAIDIAPECIRYFCEKYGKKIKVANPVMAI